MAKEAITLIYTSMVLTIVAALIVVIWLVVDVFLFNGDDDD